MIPLIMNIVILFSYSHIQGENEDVSVVVQVLLTSINHAIKPPLNSHISIPVPCYAMHISYIDLQ
jgi:hypothetical protein